MSKSPRVTGRGDRGVGVSAYIDNVNVVKAMKDPSTIRKVRRLLGIINDLGKVLSHLAEKTC